MFDYENFNLEEEIANVKKNKGFHRKENIVQLLGHVKRKYGEDAYQSILQKMKEHDMNLTDILKKGHLEWVESRCSSVLLLIIVKEFKYKQKDIVKMSQEILSISIFFKMFMRIFPNNKKTVERGLKTWPRIFSYGRPEVVEFDEINKKMIARLYDFDKHPIVCDFFLGIIAKVLEVMLGTEIKSMQESKCIHKGDDCHEYIYLW